MLTNFIFRLPLPLSRKDDQAFSSVFANQINFDKFWLDLTRTSDITFLTSENKKISYSNIKDSDYHFGVPKRLATGVSYLFITDCCINMNYLQENWAFCERPKVSLICYSILMGAIY